jgi:hypothetical protein
MAFEKGNKLGRGNKEAKLIEEALRRAIKQEDGQRIREGVRSCSTYSLQAIFKPSTAWPIA